MILTPQELDSLKWRFINTFKSVVLPIVLSIFLLDLQDTGDLSGVFHAHLWANIGYAVLVALVGSTIAGLDKVSRMRTEK